MLAEVPMRFCSAFLGAAVAAQASSPTSPVSDAPPTPRPNLVHPGETPTPLPTADYPLPAPPTAPPTPGDYTESFKRECPPTNGCMPEGGCPDTWDKVQQSLVAPEVQLDITEDFLLVYIGWPGSVVLCSLVAFAALRNKEDKGVPLIRRAVSIRFCNQIIMGYLVFQASAALFFVSLGISTGNLNEAFDLSQRTTSSLFNASNENVIGIREALFTAVSVASKVAVSDHLELFALAHNELVHWAELSQVTPDTREGRLAAVMHEYVLIEASSRLQRSLALFTATAADPDTVQPAAHRHCLRMQNAPCGNAKDGFIKGSQMSFVPLYFATRVPKFNISMSQGLYPDAIGFGWETQGPDWKGKNETLGRADVVVFERSSRAPGSPALEQQGLIVVGGCADEPSCCESPEYEALTFESGIPQDLREQPSRRAGFVYSDPRSWLECGQCKCTEATPCPADPVRFSGCRRPAPFVFPKLPLHKAQWTGVWVSPLLPSILLLDLATAVRTDSGMDGLFISTLSLFELERALRNLTTYQGQVIYLVDVSHNISSDMGVLLLSTDHDSGGMVHAVNASSRVVQLSARQLHLARETVTGFTDETDGTPYVHMATSVQHLEPSFSAKVVNVIPYYSVQGEIVSHNLELICNMTISVDRANQRIARGVQSMIITSMFCIVLSSALVFLVNKAIIAPIQTLIVDMREVSQLRLVKVLKRYELERRSRFFEIRRMQGFFIQMVRHLSELRTYLPESALRQHLQRVPGKEDDDDDNADDLGPEEDEDGDQFAVMRTVRVSIIYVSRKIANQSHKGQRTLDATLEAIPESARKREVSFVHTYPDGRPSLVQLLRECRQHLGEKPLEPLRVSACVVTEQGDTGRLNLQDNLHLDDALHYSPDHLSLIVYKDSRPDFVPVLVASATVTDFFSTCLFGFSQISRSPPAAAGVFALLGLAVAFNLHFSFDINKEMIGNPLVKEWMEVSQIETTCCLCLSAINVQNLQLLHSGIRVSRFLRFHAPVPRKMRHRIIKRSTVSLIGMDILPTLLTIVLVSEEGEASKVAMLSIALGVLATFCSCIKKLVVFCFVDPDTNLKLRSGARGKQDGRRRNALRPCDVSVVRAELDGLEGSIREAAKQGGGTGSKVGSALGAFYDHCFRIIQQADGTVMSFAAGRVDAAFNVHHKQAQHAAVAVTAGWDITLFELDTEGWPDPHSRPRALCAVASAPALLGECGGAQRRSFHLVGPAEQHARALCRLNRSMGTRLLLSGETLRHLASCPHPPRDLLMRRVDVFVDEGGETVTAVEAEAPARAAWRDHLHVYNAAFDALLEGNLGSALSQCDAFLASLPGSSAAEDLPALMLREKLARCGLPGGAVAEPSNGLSPSGMLDFATFAGGPAARRRASAAAATASPLSIPAAAPLVSPTSECGQQSRRGSARQSRQMHSPVAPPQRRSLAGGLPPVDPGGPEAVPLVSAVPSVRRSQALHPVASDGGDAAAPRPDLAASFPPFRGRGGGIPPAKRRGPPLAPQRRPSGSMPPSPRHSSPGFGSSFARHSASQSEAELTFPRRQATAHPTPPVWDRAASSGRRARDAQGSDRLGDEMQPRDSERTPRPRPQAATPRARRLQHPPFGGASPRRQRSPSDSAGRSSSRRAAGSFGDIKSLNQQAVLNQALGALQ